MAAIETQRDFLRLLREDSEFKEEVRRLILTEELLNLPARVAVIEGEVKDIRKELGNINRRLDGMDQRFDGIDRRFDGMDRRLDGMDGRMDGMDQRMDRMSDDIGYLKGEAIESRMARKIVSTISTKLELRRGTLVKGGSDTSTPAHDFDDAIYDAFESGAITEEERGRVNDTDAVIRATCRETGLRVYVAIEASFVIDDEDVERAHRTSEILSKVFPEGLTAAAVYGESINPVGSGVAEKLGVAVHFTG